MTKDHFFGSQQCQDWANNTHLEKKHSQQQHLNKHNNRATVAHSLATSDLAIGGWRWMISET